MERKWWTLLGVCVATFMLLVDVTIVNVALPSIERELHAGLTKLQWVIDAYTLVLSALILTMGALADRLGRRIVFVLGVTAFTIASLACGLAPSATALDVFRGLQGIGGAAMFATSLALIAQEFRGRDFGTAIAAWGSTVGAAVAAGPLIGGALTQGLGWEWIFFVNIPVGVIALALAMRGMREFRDPDARGIDVGGLVTSSAAFALLVFGLLRGNAEGWDSPLILGSLIGAVVLLAVFVAIERRQERPMLDLALFRRPAFVGVSLGTLAIGAGMFSILLFVSIYFQDVLGYSPFQAGLRFLPLTLLIFFVPLATRRRLTLDHSARRDARRRRGDRAVQPGDRVGGPRGGGPGAQRHGLGLQQHLPPRRGDDRGGRARRDLPERDRLEARRAAAARALRVGGSSRRQRHRSRASATGAARARGLRRGLQRDPAVGRGHRAGRQRGRVRADQGARLREDAAAGAGSGRGLAPPAVTFRPWSPVPPRRRASRSR
jgi:MFS family permease